MADLMSEALVRRLRERAQDPARRSGVAAMTAGSVDLDTALSGLAPASEQSRSLLAGLASLMGGKQVFAMSGDLGVVAMGSSREAEPARPPASQRDVEVAEGELGFTLPTELRQFYVEVADGGVGPGDGLFSLSALVEKHRELTREPVGPQGQPWPADLLAVQGDDWDLVAIHRESGELVFWDLEELDDDDELPPDQATWAASFVTEAGSLASWLSKWVETDQP